MAALVRLAVRTGSGDTKDISIISLLRTGDTVSLLFTALRILWARNWVWASSSRTLICSCSWSARTKLAKPASSDFFGTFLFLVGDLRIEVRVIGQIKLLYDPVGQLVALQQVDLGLLKLERFQGIVLEVFEFRDRRVLG